MDAAPLERPSLTSGVIRREWDLGKWVLLEGAKGIWGQWDAQALLPLLARLL